METTHADADGATLIQMIIIFLLIADVQVPHCMGT